MGTRWPRRPEPRVPQQVGHHTSSERTVFLRNSRLPPVRIRIRALGSMRVTRVFGLGFNPNRVRVKGRELQVTSVLDEAFEFFALPPSLNRVGPRYRFVPVR